MSEAYALPQWHAQRDVLVEEADEKESPENR
jgi:hypothetical protein